MVSSVRLNSELAGLLILMRPSDSSENGAAMHVGYIFGTAFWGKGLATELLRGLVRQLKMDGYKGEIHAGVGKGNPASVRVLQKVGFDSMPVKNESDVDWFCLSFAE